MITYDVLIRIKYYTGKKWLYIILTKIIYAGKKR